MCGYARSIYHSIPVERLCQLKCKLHPVMLWKSRCGVDPQVLPTLVGVVSREFSFGGYKLVSCKMLSEGGSHLDW